VAADSPTRSGVQNSSSPLSISGPPEAFAIDDNLKRVVVQVGPGAKSNNRSLGLRRDNRGG